MREVNFDKNNGLNNLANLVDVTLEYKLKSEPNTTFTTRMEIFASQYESVLNSYKSEKYLFMDMDDDLFDVYLDIANEISFDLEEDINSFEEVYDVSYPLEIQPDKVATLERFNQMTKGEK